MFRDDPDFQADQLLRSERYEPEELAELLDFDVNVIRRAVWNGELRATMAGHDIVSIDRDEVIRWLGEHGAS